MPSCSANRCPAPAIHRRTDDRRHGDRRLRDRRRAPRGASRLTYPCADSRAAPARGRMHSQGHAGPARRRRTAGRGEGGNRRPVRHARRGGGRTRGARRDGHGARPARPRPSLLRGDLRSGNVLPTTDPDGTPRVAVIDPAPSVGDGWADIAVYQLDHVLNHLTHFGSAWRPRVHALVAALRQRAEPQTADAAVRRGRMLCARTVARRPRIAPHPPVPGRMAR